MRDCFSSAFWVLIAVIASNGCHHVGTNDAGMPDADSDTDGDSDTDPFSDYDCDEVQEPCDIAMCNTEPLYENAVESCLEGSEINCALIEECLLPYYICVELACTNPDNPDMEALMSCMTDLTDCMSDIASHSHH